MFLNVDLVKRVPTIPGILVKGNLVERVFTIPDVLMFLNVDLLEKEFYHTWHSRERKSCGKGVHHF
jgi:hypothetical protein